MKNLKKIKREDLKKIIGGNVYPDMCHGDSDCAAYGLSCGIFEGHDTNGYWVALRCI